jgi:antitoxin component of RelBE/YafQ-DinJ toxin-antitoxin module
MKSDARSELLKVRIDGPEKQAFQEAADLAGIPVSAWVRERLRRAARIELMEAGRRSPLSKPQRAA